MLILVYEKIFFILIFKNIYEKTHTNNPQYKFE